MGFFSSEISLELATMLLKPTTVRNKTLCHPNQPTNPIENTAPICHHPRTQDRSPFILILHIINVSGMLGF